MYSSDLNCLISQSDFGIFITHVRSFFNVGCYEAAALLPNGENAHCTLKPIQWWKDQFEKTIKENIETHVVYSFSHMNNGVYDIYEKAIK